MSSKNWGVSAPPERHLKDGIAELLVVEEASETSSSATQLHFTEHQSVEIKDPLQHLQLLHRALTRTDKGFSDML